MAAIVAASQTHPGLDGIVDVFKEQFPVRRALDSVTTHRIRGEGMVGWVSTG
jgi:hypothetical protein